MRRGATLALLALLVAVVVLAGCGAQDIAPTGDIGVAKDASVKAQIMIVKTGIVSYMATNGALPAAASQAVLGGFVNPWPKNPWTQAPMAPGTQPGDIVYTPGGGTSYSLGVHLADGSVYTAP